MAQLASTLAMITYNNLYSKIISPDNLFLAWQKARKGKTQKKYVIEFEKNLEINLMELREELLAEIYSPKPLITFVLRDPKTRVISKSDFRDRIIHHAVVQILEPIFDKTFIFDSCANRVGKGTTFALKRFELFRRKITKNFKVEVFCLKADIKHYFQEVDLNILLGIIKRKISDEKVIWLTSQILSNTSNKANFETQREREIPTSLGKGMPLGNLTSQFFANLYLNELDYFVKHTLKARYYIRYVDDFVILHSSREQLENWKNEIDIFLRNKLHLELHPDKSKVIPLSQGVDFVGFRNFYHFKLLRKRNIQKIISKIKKYKQGEISKENILESFNGWNAYAKWANSLKLRRKIASEIAKK